MNEWCENNQVNKGFTRPNICSELCTRYYHLCIINKASIFYFENIMNIAGAGKIMTPLQLERHKTLKMVETEAAAASHI